MNFGKMTNGRWSFPESYKYMDVYVKVTGKIHEMFSEQEIKDFSELFFHQIKNNSHLQGKQFNVSKAVEKTDKGNVNCCHVWIENVTNYIILAADDEMAEIESKVIEGFQDFKPLTPKDKAEIRKKARKKEKQKCQN